MCLLKLTTEEISSCGSRLAPPTGSTTGEAHERWSGVDHVIHTFSACVQVTQRRPVESSSITAALTPYVDSGTSLMSRMYSRATGS